MFISLPRVVLNSSEALGADPQVVQFRRATTPPFPDQTRLDQVPEHHKLLCQSPQEPLSVTDITSAYKKNGDTGNHQINLPPTRGVGYLCSFSRIPTFIYHYRNSPGNISDFMSRVGHNYSKLTAHCNCKEVKLMAMYKDIKSTST